MKNKLSLNKMSLCFSVLLFLPLLIKAQITECTPGASSAANDTEVGIDTGVSFPPILDQTSFMNFVAICEAERDNAPATIDVIFNGTATTFAKTGDFVNSGTNTCEIVYDNPSADPLISAPFAVDFPDVTDLCNYDAVGVLPVELQHFKVELKGNTVLLEWETLVELNNDRFEILHSSDSKNWSLIGTVPGVGDSRELQYYSMLDENPVAGNNYYALVQFDKDGKSTVSRVKVVQLEVDTYTKLYPNPASENLTVEISENVKLPAQLRVFDSLGRNVKSVQVNDYFRSIDLNGLDKGFYYLRVSDERRIYSSDRFVKQ